MELTTNQTMTSLEIVELINQQRKLNSEATGERYVKLRHDNFMNKAPKILGKEIAEKFIGIYSDNKNRNYKCYIFPEHEANILLTSYSVGGAYRNHKKRESIALSVIEQLIGRPLYHQFRVLNYYIDGYDPVDKIAYEIDEEQHEYQSVADAKRQEEIEHVLGCTFKRIKV